MILILKNSKTSILKKIIGFSLLIIMFAWYYFHMQNFYQTKISLLQKQKTTITSKNNVKAKRLLAKKLEKLIYKEAETCVELIGQEHIQKVEIKNDKLLIVADWNVNIEPIFIRYGVLALIKSTPENKKIAIDLKYLVESRYE
jgi:hypothetical protein